MDFIDVTESNDNSLTVGDTFFITSSPDIPEIESKEPELNDNVTEDDATNVIVGNPAEEIRETADQEDKEIEDFLLDDYKIIGQLRPQDCYVIQKLRNGVIVPTWQMPGTPGRQIGKVLVISGNSAAEYTENLERAGDSCFPESSTNRALEVIY